MQPGCILQFELNLFNLECYQKEFDFLRKKSHHDDGVSSFQALMISTASRVGTGNIAGVATALAAGGAGSIFWMWIIALIGGASAFIESTLAQVYKKKTATHFVEDRLIILKKP
mgnify:CR=1 FL=1